MIETPRGYFFGHVSGKTGRMHLVKCEVYEATALCGVQVFHNSLSETTIDSQTFCPKCIKKLKELGVEWKSCPT